MRIDVRRSAAALAFLLAFLAVPLAAKQEPVPAAPLTIHRAAGPISIDGDLSDAGWQGALKFETWYETNPGDNIEPKWKTVGYITYDDRFFYAAIHSYDDPKAVTAALGDHDQISGNNDDFAGVILDTRNDGKTAVEFFVTAAGTQYDAAVDDATGNEDSSPDLFWDSSVKKVADGWILEMRVPFSSLRYQNKNPQTWGLIMYRNVPRERRYQIFTNKLPRGTNCFVCDYNKVSGFEGLPSGGHVIAAPYATAKSIGELSDDGSEQLDTHTETDAGIDVKYTPNEHTAIDATLNPDFSQIESDVAQISTNERFAINYPEKRPFFLERVELLSTPITAVYTRTITSPRWGLRGTGNYGSDNYTLLIAQDRGGGVVIVPGPEGSRFAEQNFSSTDTIGRWRHDVGSKAFYSFLITDKEMEGGGSNRVFGPDFQWRPDEANTVTGQILFSQSDTPNRPDDDPEWNGQSLSSYGGDLWWQYTNPKLDVFTEYKDFGDDFRADLGFVPQVGYRLNYGEMGYTQRPKGFFSRVRYFAMAEYDSQQDGAMLYRLLSAGIGGDGRHRSNFRFRYADESISNGGEVLNRRQLYYQLQFAISRKVPQLSFDGWVGEDIDFYNNRPGTGARINMSASLRPTSQLQMSLTGRVQWLSEEAGDLEGRLFTSQVERLRAQYMFTPRMFIRAIVQNQRTNYNPELYGIEDLPTRGGALSSQFLFAYKLNWQSVLYLGYGDIRDVTSEEETDPTDPAMRTMNHDFLLTDRQVFLKVSYAFQR